MKMCFYSFSFSFRKKKKGIIIKYLALFIVPLDFDGDCELVMTAITHNRERQNNLENGFKKEKIC